MAEITKYVDKKFAAVDHNGPIYTLGGIYGPTLPMIMDVSEIALLIQRHYRVNEHLTNGKVVKLDMTNYNIDLNGDEGAGLENIPPVNNDPAPVPSPEEIKAAEEKAAADAAAAAKATEEADKNNKGPKDASGSTSTVIATPANAQQGGKSTSESKADNLTKK